MKGTSKLQSRHLSADRPLQRLRGCFLGDNAAVPPAYRVKVEKCASSVDILDVCKFTTFCDRKGYRRQKESNCAYRRRTVRSWVSRARVFAPIENVWRSLMNMLMVGKQGRKNPRYTPKFTINREPFSRAMKKISEIYGRIFNHQRVSNSY